MGYRSTVTARTDGITLACRQALSAMVWTQDIRANVTCSSGSSISLWKGIQGTFLCIPSKLSLSILSSNLAISKLNPLEVVSHHNFKRVRIIHICPILDQAFVNHDV